ncbi:MAG: radical SAM protein, partial [Promethearchaeota archaeon]
FYDKSGGGLTLSGGEPLLQIDFVEEFLQKAKENGIHCCIETCGYLNWSNFERVLPLVDVFLFDIKDTNDKFHQKFTGKSNKKIFENLYKLHEQNADIILRLPIIPGCNDRPDHFKGIATLLKSLPHIKRVEIMPYHRFGKDKTKRFGLVEPDEVDRKPPTKKTIQEWINQFLSYGVEVIIGT